MNFRELLINPMLTPKIKRVSKSRLAAQSITLG
jgi:hypothetical protein